MFCLLQCATSSLDAIKSYTHLIQNKSVTLKRSSQPHVAQLCHSLELKNVIDRGQEHVDSIAHRIK